MFDYAMKSKKGNRPYNEDGIRMHDSGKEQIFALADGLGGMGNGALASSIALRSVIGRFCWDKERGQRFLADEMETAQNAVMYGQKKYPEAVHMSTTLCLLYLSEDKAQWAHVGDSRIYMFRRNKVIYQTEDHSVPQMLVKAGEIFPSQIRHHPDRNRLLHALGREWNDQGYSLSEIVKVMSGDAFLLCSDGFWEEIGEQDMLRELRRADNAAQWMERMKKIVETNGKDRNMDNYSAICVCIR